ncbi:hypothetical protein JQM84_11145 [Parabacteroides distasonis]|nr:hypothetical protein [Parabacteroides distasonis]
MKKKFFTLAAALMLSSAFGTVSAIDATGPANKVVLVKDAEATTGVKFVSGNSYFVVMTGTDATINEGEFVMGVKKATGRVSATTKKASELLFSGEDYAQFVWTVKEVKESVSGKKYYTFYNAKAEVYLSFKDNGSGAMILQDDPTKTEPGTKDVYAYFDLGDGDDYKGDGQSLKLAGIDKYVNLNAASAITTETDNTNLKFTLWQADEIIRTAKTLNTWFTGGPGGLSLKFATEPDENIFGQKMLAFQMDGKDAETEAVDHDDYAWEDGYPQGTYFAVSYPAAGIVSKADFLASTFISMDLDTKYDLNGLDNTKGQGYAYKTVKGSDLIAAPDIKEGELPAANACFTVVEKEPTSKPDKYTISLNATVINKDKEYEGGKAVYVYVAPTDGKKYLTTGSGATLAERGASNNVKAEALLKADKPAIYNIKFTSGEDATDSEKGKYLMVNSDNGDWSLFADGSAFTNMEGPAAQWTIASVTEDGKFVFRNRETAVELTLGLNTTVTGKTAITSAKLKDDEDPTFEYGYVDEGEHVASNNADVHLNATTIKLIEVENIDPMAGYLNITDHDLAYGPVKIGFHAQNALIANDLYLNEEDGNVAAQKTISTYWNITKWDRSAAAMQTAKSDTIMTVKGYAYWDAKNKKVKTAAAGDTVAMIAYSFSPVNSDKYLNNVGTALVVAGNAGKFVFRENADGSLAMVKVAAGNANPFNTKETKAASLTTADGTVAWDAAIPFNNINGAPYRSISLTQDAMVSLEGASRHAALQSVNGGFIGIGEENEAILAVKEEAGKALTFWLDTADAETYLPSFYISRATTLKAEGDRLFLFNPADSATYYNAGAASMIKDPDYFLGGNVNDDMVKAIFRPATLVNADTLTTTINGKEATIATVANAETKVLGGLNAYKFNIVLADEDTEDEYVIRSLATAEYLVNINGKLAFSDAASQALVIKLTEGDATANEAIAAEGVQVIGGQGAVTVQGAAGKVITVADILGRTIANQVAASDNVTIAAPAGVVIVAVEGDATKVVVK